MSKRKTYFFLKIFHFFHILTWNLLSTQNYSICIVVLWGIFLNSAYFPLVWGYLDSLFPSICFYSVSDKLNNRRRAIKYVPKYNTSFWIKTSFPCALILKPYMFPKFNLSVWSIPLIKSLKLLFPRLTTEYGREKNANITFFGVIFKCNYICEANYQMVRTGLGGSGAVRGCG